MNCKKCGEPLESNWKRCPNCGAPTGMGKTVRNKKKAVYKNWWFWMMILLLIVVIGLVAYIGILSKKGTKDEKNPEQKNEAKEVTDLSGYDLETLLDKPETNAAEIGLEKSEESQTYTGMDGNIQIAYQDGNLVSIMIQGSEAEIPSFHGIRTGMPKEEAVNKMTDAYPEIVDSGESIQFMNLDTKRNVVCGLNENNVTSIHFSVLSDEEAENYRQAKADQLQAQYIFPDSNSRYLSEEEVRSVESGRLFIGRNEIFARHGYIFQDEGLRQHFNSMPWYSGTVSADQFDSEALFNDFEKKNAELIKRVEDEINGGSISSGEFIGMTGVYVSTNSLGGSMSGNTGKIEITNIGEGAVTFSLGLLEWPQYVLTENAQIINNNTAQIELYGFVITFTWTDGENVYVTHQGELTGMDSATIMDITNNQGYIRPYEFNKW